MNLEELYTKFGKLKLQQEIIENEVNITKQQIGNILNSMQKAQDKPEKEIPDKNE